MQFHLTCWMENLICEKNFSNILFKWYSFFFFFFLKNFTFIYLFIYFWLCWVFVSVRGLSLVAASGGHSSSPCVGLSLSQPLLLWSTGSRRAGSVVVAHGLSCSVACGIFPDQVSNPCPLHWQADSQPLRHQGSPQVIFLFSLLIIWLHISIWLHNLSSFLFLLLGLTHIIETRKVLDLRINLKPSYLIVPQTGFHYEKSDLLILDFGTFQVGVYAFLSAHFCSV